jgi:acyl-CoA reductase-like NAD-dependent aldehyde dehydrogenase
MELPLLVGGSWGRSARPRPVTCPFDDHMPYGGVKDSGIGREGPRDTIEEMTEPKIVVINRDLA